MNKIYSNLESKRTGILKYSGKIVLLIVFFFTAISSFAQIKIGNSNIETGTPGSRSLNHIEAWDKFTTTQKVTVTSFVIYQLKAGVGNMRVGLYKDSSTGPSTLVPGSDSGSIALLNIVNNWATYDVPDFNLDPGTYWIGISFDGNNPNWNAKSNGSGSALTQYFRLSIGYGLPASWPTSGGTSSGSVSNGSLSMYFNACNSSIPPTITTSTTPAVVDAVCFNADSQKTTMGYTATTNSPTQYSIDWDTAANTVGLTDQGITNNNFVRGAGNVLGIVVPANVPAGTYSGTMIISNAGGCTNVKAITLTINPLPPIISQPNDQGQNVCLGSAIRNLSVTTSGAINKIEWFSNNVASTTGGTLVRSTNYRNFGTITDSYTPANTTAGTFYYYTVITGDNGCSVKSDISGAIIVSASAPATPGSISGSVIQCAGSTLQTYSISPVANATSYVWTVDTNSGWVITSGQGTNSIVVTVGNAGNKNVSVNAINACGIGYGPYLNVAVNPKPSAPGTAGAYSSTCTGFTAQWAYTNYASKYFLDVSTSSTFTSFISGYNNLDVGNNLFQVLSGLNPGTTYYYRVRAYGNCGTSNNSTTMSFATAPVPTTSPTANAATNIQCNAASINWSSVSNATGYYVDIATNFTFTNFVPGYNNLYVGYVNYYAAGLPAGTLFYRIRATNSCGVTTSNSNVISFATPAPVGGSVSPAQTICSGSSPSNSLTLKDYTPADTKIIKWQKATDLEFTTNVFDINVDTNVLSIANIGVLNVSTYFRAVVQNQFGAYCISYSTPVLITVNGSISAASVSPTLCINTLMPTITHTTSGFTGIGVVTGLPAGVSASFASNTITITGTPTAAGTFNYNIPLTGGCDSSKAVGRIIVNNAPSFKAIASPEALCVGGLIDPTTPTLAANGSTITASGWQLENVAGIFSNITVPYTVAFGDNGKKIRFYATNSCGTSYSNEVVLRVNNLPTISEINAPAPLCAGSSLNPTTPTVVANGSTITASGWQLETGVGTNSYVPINVPYTVAFGDNGKKIRYSAANSCGSTSSKSFDLVVNPILTASVNITTPTNFICPGSSVLLTFASQVINQGSSPTYQWQLNGVDLPGETSSTLSTSALVVGDRVKLRMTSNENPCLSDSQVSSNEILIATQTAVYNGGWVINPAANLSAEIRSAYDLAVNVEACKLLVTNNAPVTIKTGHYFKIQNGITVDNGSVLKVESDANLIQNNDAAINTGNITAERDIKIGTIRAQYNYFGSPVAFEATQSYKTIYPGITNVLLYNQATNYFVNSSGVNIPGRGLALKEPTPATPINGSKITAQYKGVPQNGEIILGIANKDIDSNTFGFNLIGNPYPSNIDLRKLYDINGGNTDVPQFESRSISPTFYFWDNNNNDKFNQQGSGYDGQSYAIFNVLTGSNGTGTEAGSLSGALIGSKKPTKIVKVGQGFMTRSLRDTYDFKFNNSIRTVATSIFDFLGKESSNKEDDRYWLKMIAPSGISSTIAIVHYPAGNDSFGLEDSESMGGSDALYSIVENKKVAINGRSNFKSQDVVPLGTKHFALGNYTIALDSPEGIFGSGQSIYLKDKQAGIITDLSKGNYSFSTAKGENTGRFEIIYKPETVLAIDSKTKEQLMVYKDGSDFVVKSQSKNITALEVYDTTGRLITQLQPNQTKVIIPAESLVNGVYILKINQNGVITSKKIIK